MSLGVVNTSHGIDKTSSFKPKTSKLTLAEQDTGVKRILIISIAVEVPDFYKIIKALLDLINTKNVKFVTSCDFKVANRWCGIQSHSSKHSCCRSDIDSDNFSTRGVSRTF